MRITNSIENRNKKFSNLFSPLKIGQRTIKNRIVSTSHATGFDNGILSEHHVHYHERKAMGGAGLVMTFGSASVTQGSSASYGSVSLWDPKNEPLLTNLANRVHQQGALIISQATHMGRRVDSTGNGQPAQAPSAIPEEVHHEIPHVLRTDEIPPIIEDFARVAKRLERCGWDGIEITSFGGHLIEQFWSPIINNRTDQYGGDLTGRMRFSVEVIEAVANAVSEDFIISFRMSGDPLTTAIGLDQNDMLNIAAKLDKSGYIDLFNISGGTGATFNAQTGVVPGDTFPRAPFNHLSQKIKEQVSVPVLVAGRILDPEQAERALNNGDCDLVGMTRAIIADPDMPKHAQKGEISSIRPCIACGDCISRVFKGMPLKCTVNPAITDDSLYNFESAKNKLRVVVVGGGPAGMNAANVAAKRGHQVFLLERAKQLGGQVISASSIPERPHYERHIKWLESELIRLNVNIQFDTVADKDIISSLKPDELILATGSTSFIPFNISDILPHSITDVELLDKKAIVEPRSNVLIYDWEGESRGANIANFIAESGASKIELATPLWSVCDKLDGYKKSELYRLLGNNNVLFSPNQHISQVNGEICLSDIWSGGKKNMKGIDLVVFVGYQKAEDVLVHQFLDASDRVNVHTIGDAIAPRNLNDAVFEGVRLGSIL